MKMIGNWVDPGTVEG